MMRILLTTAVVAAVVFGGIFVGVSRVVTDTSPDWGLDD